MYLLYTKLTRVVISFLYVLWNMTMDQMYVKYVSLF